MKTALNGYRYAVNHRDPSIRDRAKPSREMALTTRHFLLASRLLSENAATARLVRELKAEYNRLFGSGGLKEAALNAVVAGLALKERVWTRLFGDVRQPPLLVTNYRMAGAGASERGRKGSEALGYVMKKPAEA